MRRIAPTLESWLAGWSNAERGVLAHLWGLSAGEEVAAEQLVEAMTRPEAVGQVVRTLEASARSVIERVAARGGSIAAHTLEQEYGGIGVAAGYVNPRVFLLARGVALQPVERLFALALLRLRREGSALVYEIPPELLALLPAAPGYAPIAELAVYDAPFDHTHFDPTLLDDQILTLLSLAHDGQLVCVAGGALSKAGMVRLARAWGIPAPDLRQMTREAQWPFASFLRAALQGAGLLRVDAERRLRVTRVALGWMRRSRAERVAELLAGWIASNWDELARVGLVVRHAPDGERQAARRALLGLLIHLPPSQWVGYDDLVAAIRRVAPDFARSDGRYDSWGVRERGGGALDGYAHWSSVEGHLIRAVITQPLYWLSIVDIGWRGDAAVSVRLNDAGMALLAGERSESNDAVDALIVGANFEVLAPPGCTLYARFQLGRFAERIGGERVPVYRLTRRSVQQALDRGATIDDLIGFLRDESREELPQHVVVALRDWADRGSRVVVQRAVLIESDDPIMLEAIQRDARVDLPQAVLVSAASLVVREHDATAVIGRLRNAGYDVHDAASGVDALLRERDLVVLRIALEFYAQAAKTLGFESDVSGALRRRLAGLLAPPQIVAADDAVRAAIERFDEHVVPEATRDSRPGV